MIYKYKNANMNQLESTSFSKENILERQHLQAALKKKIHIVAPDCLVLAEGFSFSEWSESGRRIDLLAINKEANLVIIELKRDDSGDHMELQAIRYAAMASTLTYRKVIKIYQSHLEQEGKDEDAEENLLRFLEWNEPNEEDFALDVKITLVSSNFSKELTTSVLWLNDKNLDIRCVRLMPYKFKDDILINVQQVIPLPEAEEYQIRLREKLEEKRRAVQSSRDYTKYKFNGQEYNKRNLVLAVVKRWIVDKQPQSIKELMDIFPQELHSSRLLMKYSKAKEISERQQIDRHFLSEDDIISFEGDDHKYVVSNQWGKHNINIFIQNAGKIGYMIEPVK